MKAIFLLFLLATSLDAATVFVPRRKTHSSQVDGVILSMDRIRIGDSWNHADFCVDSYEGKSLGNLEKKTVCKSIIGLGCRAGSPRVIFDGETPTWFICVEGGQ